jgi:hypothetical protein
MSGSVQRLVNAVSTAEVTIRNPDMRFTKTSRTKEGPYFKPMDQITIWLERIRGYPVQVFTGYLDQVPYLQLYPGPCTLTASCTLKRLQHTYWDMGLNYVSNWLAKYEWEGSKSTGQLLSTRAEGEALGVAANPLNDGSIGHLLYGTLVDVADWPKDRIHIEALPTSIAAKVINIYNAYAEDSEEIAKSIEAMIKRYIGEGNVPQGKSSGAESGGNGSIPDLPSGGSYSICQLKQIAATQPFKDINEAAAIMYAESKGDPKVYNGTCCWGLWQIHQGNNGFSQEMATDPARSTKTAYDMSTGGTDWGQWQAFGNSDYQYALAEARKCSLVRASDLKGRGSQQNKSGGKLRTGSDSTTGNKKEDSKWVYPLEIKGDYIGGVAAHMARAFGNWMSDNAVDLGVPKGTKALAVESGTITRVSGSYISDAANPNGYTVYLRGKSGLNYAYMHFTQARVSAGDHVDQGDVVGITGSANSVPHLHFACEQENPETVIGEGNITSPGAPGSGGTPGSDGPDWEDVLSTSKAAAFVQELQFPGLMESFESMSLTGAKSLMNDKPLFPFVEQLSKAAMRSFQSLPNGDFYAFYPDYFGHDRDRSPYWMIDDIEVLAGEIRLSDDALATHVFGVGDTMPFTPGIDTLERTTSGGIVNVFNVAQSGFNPASTKTEERAVSERIRKQHRKALINDPTSVVKFLQKYGARPHVEEAPLVRSRFYEAFLAWSTFNLLWSRQFLTEFQFTFMPEIFPGGIVGFTNHGLQCYVDQVTHTFDYEQGFTTTAALSAPASLNQQGIDDPISFGLVRGAS